MEHLQFIIAMTGSAIVGIVSGIIISWIVYGRDEWKEAADALNPDPGDWDVMTMRYVPRELIETREENSQLKLAAELSDGTLEDIMESYRQAESERWANAATVCEVQEKFDKLHADWLAQSANLAESKRICLQQQQSIREYGERAEEMSDQIEQLKVSVEFFRDENHGLKRQLKSYEVLYQTGVSS